MRKTIQAGLVELTNIKKQQLKTEYKNLQEYLKTGKDVELYSANRQQAERFYDTIKEDKEYPISIRKDLIDIESCETDIADYFVKIPTAQRYGGLKLPTKTHTEIKENWEICESKVFKRDGRFYINITVSYEAPETKQFKGVIGIDLGLKRPVTCATLSVADNKVGGCFF